MASSHPREHFLLFAHCFHRQDFWIFVGDAYEPSLSTASATRSIPRYSVYIYIKWFGVHSWFDNEHVTDITSTCSNKKSECLEQKPKDVLHDDESHEKEHHKAHHLQPSKLANSTSQFSQLQIPGCVVFLLRKPDIFWTEMVHYIDYVVGCDVAMDSSFSSTPSHPVVVWPHG